MKAREVIARTIDRAQFRTDHEEADAILAALARAGLAVVPVEATEKMIEAAYEAGDWGPGGALADDITAEKAYRAMIAAARKETDHDE